MANLITGVYWCDGTSWKPFQGAVVTPPTPQPGPGRAHVSKMFALATAPAPITLGAGSLPIGQANYTIQSSGVVYVSVAGDDGAVGNINTPVATVQRACDLVQADGMIVLRGGVYHQGKVGTASVYAGISCTKANVKIQNYPGEAVWFDGSSVVSGWTADGAGRWRVPWTVKFDRSPTFTFGGAEDPRPGWTFVDSTYYPCAAWPDQVFVDGQPLTQVNTLARVTDSSWPLNPNTVGKFFVDQANNFAYINIDPTGKTVRMSDLQTTLSAGAAGVVIRGIGFRKFAPSNPHFGCTKAYRDNCVYENVIIEDCSNTGVSFQTGSGMTMSKLTVRRCGGLGIHANNTNNLTVEYTQGVYNGTGYFNHAPVSGALKATRLRNMTIRNCEFNFNTSKGVWLDETVTFPTIVNNDIIGNGQRGMVCELGGGTYTIANNRFCGNGYEGLVVFNVDKLRAWNNTIGGNGGGTDPHTKALYRNIRQFSILADDRAPMSATTSAGVTDSRYGYPHPDNVTWTMTQLESKNNVVVSEGTVNQQTLFGIEDYKKNTGAAKGWQTYGLDMNGNVYARPNSTSPAWIWILANAGSANVSVVTSMSQMRTLTSQEGTSLFWDNTDALTDIWTLRNQSTANAAAVALPSDIATLIGQPVGTKRAGAFR